MKSSWSLPIFLCCSICAAQTVLNAPGNRARPSPSLPSMGSVSDCTADVFDDCNAPQSLQSLPKVPRRTTAGPRRLSATPLQLENQQGARELGLSTPSKLPAPIINPSDFQLFAEDDAGHPLPVYGRQLFEDVPSFFPPFDGVPVPADYVLGPGDELQIRVWGKVEFEARVTIDRDGQISLPRVGTLRLAGLRYEQLQSFLTNAVGKIYKDFELNVSLGQLRSIQIFVLGSARRPGAYTVSSLSTLVNALFASGGPSATGSMRSIQLRRNNHMVSEFDIYDLLRNGDKSHDVQLHPGDVIYIPRVGPQVAILANVNEPGIYELKGETTLGSAIQNAGGLTNLAGLDRVLLERIENRSGHQVDDFALDSTGLRRVLSDGDLVRIFAISPRFENAVTIRGNFAVPGRYPWHDGMRVSDLIPSHEFLIKHDHWKLQNHRSDSFKPETNLAADQSTLQEKSRVDILDDLAADDAELNWDYASIERLDEH